MIQYPKDREQNLIVTKVTNNYITTYDYILIDCGDAESAYLENENIDLGGA